MQFTRTIRDNGVQKVTDATQRLAQFPSDGDLVEQLNDNSLWAWNATAQTWVQINGGGGGSTPGGPNNSIQINNAGTSLTGSSNLLYDPTTGYIYTLGIEDGSGKLSIDPNSRYLYDSTGTNVSVQYGNRELENASNTIVLNWAGTNLQTFTNIDFQNTFTGINVPTPINPGDTVSKSYADGLASGQNWKETVQASTTGNVSLSGAPFTADGHVVFAGERILVQFQTSPLDNGIYILSTGTWARSSDFAMGSSEVGAIVPVLNGTLYGDKAFRQFTDPCIVGTDSVDFTLFNNSTYTASGLGIILTGGNIFALQIADSTLSQSGSGVQVAVGGITDTQVSTTAGIQLTKLAALNNSIVPVTSTSGFLTNSSTTTTQLGFLDATSSIQTQLNSKLSTVLTSGDIYLGNASNVATPTAISGGATISNTGVITLGNTAVTGQAITGYVSGAGTITATDTILTAIEKLNGNISGLVSSFNSRTGAVIPQSGDYTTALVTESGNLYFTNARAIASTLTAYSSTTGTITSADTILTAIEKLNGNQAALVTGVSSVFGRSGVVVATSGDYTTAQVTESGSLYFTNARAIASTLTGYVSGAGTITSTDSVLSAIEKLDGNTAAITGSYVSSFNSRTGAVTPGSSDYTTSQVAEGSNLYFTNARAIASTLTGYTSGAGTISSSDTILTAIQKLNGNIVAGSYTFSTGLTNTSNTITANLSTGISGGQSAIGGTSSGDSLTLSSTTNSTKGKIISDSIHTWSSGLGGITHILGPTDQALALSSGTPVSGAGNNITLSATSAVGTSSAGGGMTFTAGAGGASTSPGNGGSISIVGGIGGAGNTQTGAANGNGGNVSISGGAAGSPSGQYSAGGNVTISGGANAGGAGTPGSAGGNVTLNGSAASNNQPAGSIFLNGGAASGSNTGGSINLTSGTSSTNGGVSGNIVIAVGAPASNSSASVAGGLVSITSGAGKPASGSGSGAGGAVTITANSGGNQAATTGTNTAGAGGLLSLIGSVGGTSTGSGATSNTAGAGSGISMTSGTGGAASGAATSVGGAGGDVLWTLGGGGAANATTAATAGRGSNLTISGGTGGNATGAGTNLPGNGSSIAINTGAGGTASGGSVNGSSTGGSFSVTTGIGGTSGAINLTTGAGNNSGNINIITGNPTSNVSGNIALTTGNGPYVGSIALTIGVPNNSIVPGTLSLQGGSFAASFAAAGSQGGAVTITAGQGQNSAVAAGTGGTGGPITITGGAAGKQNTTNGVGGAGGAINLVTPAGGNATGTTTTGGNAGNLNIQLGIAGTGTAANGTSGQIIVTQTLSGSDTTAALSITPTWNTAGSPTAIKLNVTNTASGTSSKLIDLQVGSTSQFNVDKSGNVTAGTTASFVGTNTSNNATTGNIGEYITSTVASGSAVSLTTATTANVTSISLTAGDWDVTGVVDYSATVATATQFQAGSSSNSATLGAQDSYSVFPLSTSASSAPYNQIIPVTRYSLASTTTIYLVSQVTFSVGAISAYGTIRARRAR